MPITVSSRQPSESATPLIWDNRHIGDLEAGVWRKPKPKANQWCYKYDAPGIQARVFDSLAARGLVERIEVGQRDGTTLWLTTDEFYEQAIRDTLHPAAGEQLFVPRPKWHVEYPEVYQPPLDLQDN